MRVSRLRTESQKKLSSRQPCARFEVFFQPFSRPFEGCFCGVLRVGASSPSLSVAMLRSSQLPHAHRPCAPRGRLERGTNSAAVESRTSAKSVAMSLMMQVPSGIGGSASTIAFTTTWNRRFESVINRLRSASFGVSLVLSLFRIAD